MSSQCSNEIMFKELNTLTKHSCDNLINFYIIKIESVKYIIVPKYNFIISLFRNVLFNFNFFLFLLILSVCYVI